MIPKAIQEAEDTIPTPTPLLEWQDPMPAEQKRGIDLVLLAGVLALLVIGTVEIYSASAVYAAKKLGSSTYFLVRHLIYLGMGLTALWWGARTDFGWLKRYTYPLLLFAIVLLASVLIVGTRVGGARRWFHLGPLSLQPVEIAKLALVTYLASSLASKQDKVKTFTIGFVPHLVACGLMMALLLLQPDLGSSLILGATTLILLFVAGTKLSYILIAVLAAAPIVYHAIVGTPWRLRRLVAFLDPWQFREGVGYQITESLISIGSGGVFGLGLGDGKQKLFYMPEAHTDFIMSNIGEELGFVGFCLVLVLYALITWRGARAAAQAREPFGTFLAFGLTSMVALQALVNTAVVLGALPAKGLTLPFISYGGTSLV
ncbi:MAG: putative lipid II flippase FtsW, partial [Deltaproteobacteria bacterium]|nr:putative lipid II flippase FtsW [Deltaproteobacteria bacterium]